MGAAAALRTSVKTDLAAMVRSGRVEILTVRQLGARIGEAPNSIYKKISSGEYGPDQGFVHLNDRCTRVVWEIFWERQFLARLPGEFSKVA